MYGYSTYILDINTDDQLPHVGRDCERCRQLAA